MRPVHFILLAAGLLLLSASSCKKPNSPGNGSVPGTVNAAGSPSASYGGAVTSLNKVFRDFRYTPQTKCVTAGKLQTVVFSGGTRITFYPNSFKDGAGNTITSGTVCLEVTEMYKPGDFVSNRASTLSGTNLLTSTGQIYITASKDGQEVYPNKYRIAFKQAGHSSQDMMLFYGNINNKDSVVQWGNGFSSIGMMATVTTDTTGAPTDSATGGAPGGSFYTFDSCTDFNWVNSDYFYGSTGAKTEIKLVVADTGATFSNTQVFMVFPSINAVIPLSGAGASPLTFKGYNIPEGLTASIVVTTKKYGVYYYQEAIGFTVSSGMNLTATTTPQTLAYIKGKLAAL